jgi:hypothetical protein
MKLNCCIILLTIVLTSCGENDTAAGRSKTLKSEWHFQKISDLNVELPLPSTAQIIGKGKVVVRSMDPNTFNQAKWEDRLEYFEIHFEEQLSHSNLREVINNRCDRSTIVKESSNMIWYQNNCARLHEFILALGTNIFIIQSGQDTVNNNDVFNILLQARLPTNL